MIVGLAVSSLLWASLYIYFKTSKFNFVLEQIKEKHVNVELEKLAPPPPPPPPPPKNTPPPPPPKIQPREVPPPPFTVPTPPPLQIPPVKKEDRVEVPIPVAPAPPPPPVHNPIIANPDWIRRPNGDDFAAYYPPAALERGTEGHTTMECTVTAQGTLTNCVITEESPAGAGFGNAAKRLASKFKMRPQTADGRPVEGGKVIIPISWKLK